MCGRSVLRGIDISISTITEIALFDRELKGIKIAYRKKMQF